VHCPINGKLALQYIPDPIELYLRAAAAAVAEESEQAINLMYDKGLRAGPQNMEYTLLLR